MIIVTRGESYPILLLAFPSVFLIVIVSAMLLPNEGDFGVWSALPFLVAIAVMMILAARSTRRVVMAKKIMADGICYDAEILEFIRTFIYVRGGNSYFYVKCAYVNDDGNRIVINGTNMIGLPIADFEWRDGGFRRPQAENKYEAKVYVSRENKENLVIKLSAR